MLSREPGKAGRLSAPLERGQGHNGVKPAYLPGQGQLQLRAADLGEPPSPGGRHPAIVEYLWGQALGVQGCVFLLWNFLSSGGGKTLSI